MTTADGSVAAPLRRHPRGWLVVRLNVPVLGPMRMDLDLMLNTGRPQSVISRRTHQTLTALGQLTPAGGSGFVIRDARLGSAAIPDFRVRLSAGPALLGLEGMLGLDFLALFAEARLDVRVPRLTLVRA